MDRIQQAIEKVRHQSPKVSGCNSGFIPETLSGTQWQQTIAANSDCETGVDYRNIYSLELDGEILRRNKVITGLNNDPLGADYRAIAACLLQNQANDDWNGLAVTSPGKGNGKTLTAINIAMAAAGQVNHRIVIVDLDLPRASLQRILGFDCEFGLSDYFQRKVPLESAMIQVIHPNLVVMPVGKPNTQCFSRLAPEAVQKLHNDLSERLGNCTVIYDIPPLLCSDDARRLIPAFDAALLVVEDGVTLDIEVSDAFDFLVGSRWVGTILNKAV